MGAGDADFEVVEEDFGGFLRDEGGEAIGEGWEF